MSEYPRSIYNLSSEELLEILSMKHEPNTEAARLHEKYGNRGLDYAQECAALFSHNPNPLQEKYWDDVCKSIKCIMANKLSKK